jgi:hypothetical protein
MEHQKVILFLAEEARSERRLYLPVRGVTPDAQRSANLDEQENEARPKKSDGRS